MERAMKATFLNRLGCRLDEFTFSKDELEDARERIASDWVWMLGPGDKIVLSDDPSAFGEDEPGTDGDG